MRGLVVVFVAAAAAYRSGQRHGQIEGELRGMSRMTTAVLERFARGERGGVS